jgi:hypothetical protein
VESAGAVAVKRGRSANAQPRDKIFPTCIVELLQVDERFVDIGNRGELVLINS